MSNKLSHSAITTYNECGFKYKLSYVDRMRPRQQKSSLLFGSAVDAAIEHALKDFPLSSSREIKQIFLDKFTNVEINGEKVFAPTSELIKYSKKDESWESLKQRGLLLVDTFFKEIWPNIEKVYSVQEAISLENNAGDKVVGFSDAILKWKGYKQPIIFDFKTAGMPYKPNAVKESEQLSLYKHALNEKYRTNTAGYIVFNKILNMNTVKTCSVCKNVATSSHKTCNKEIGSTRCNGAWIVTTNPSIDVQVLIDDIDEKFEDGVLTRFDAVAQEMQAPSFDKNFKNCYGKYGKCDFYDLCHNNKSEDFVKYESKRK